ncbi:MAG: urease accessory protein UreD [Firmicutes bacterium]|nr:urease accessory protein UreD [Bacillota bacterium]
MAQAEASLSVGYDQRRRCTQLLDSFAQPPLQWLFPTDDSFGLRATLVQLGGILQGDRYRVRLDLHERAALRLTTQAATKLYRMPQQMAKQKMEVRLGDGAFFCYLPEEVIPFAESNFEQRIDVHLGKGARAVLWEILTPGRSGIHEYFRYRRYQTRMHVWESGSDTPILWENQVFCPKKAPLDNAAAFGSATHLGSFWFLTQPPDEACALFKQEAERLLAAANPLPRPYAFADQTAEDLPFFHETHASLLEGRAISQETADRTSPFSPLYGGPLYGGATLLPAGILIRVLGSATAPIHSLFAQLLEWLKKSIG